ncbi:MAG: hypothetical protein HOO06_04105 [Bdellovibrionaceae bacterium]|jgi:hypothetical protein|nr:hypothetical protein [Pseudobdellovibrionaceae bacterium]
MKFANIFKNLVLAMALAASLFGAAFYAKASEVRGFSKLNYLNYDSPNDNLNNSELFQINRLSFVTQLSEQFSFESSYEFSQIYTDIESPLLKKSYSAADKDYRIDDIEQYFDLRENYYYLNQNLDRLFATYEKEQLLITFGRQPIAFGSGSGVNPTDVFTPFSYTTIDTEERNGVDAVRLRYELDNMGQLDMGILFGKSFNSEKSAFYGLVKLPFADFEVQPMLAYFKTAMLVGLDITTGILGASVWLESAWVKTSEEKEYFRSVLGFTRQLSTDLTLTAEYYFNGAGRTKKQEYANLLTDFAHTEGGVFVFGQNYLHLTLAHQLAALHGVFLSLKNNLDDSSDLVILGWEWNVLENTYVNVGSYLNLKQDNKNEINKTEFGSLPKTIFTRVRYYF